MGCKRALYIAALFTTFDLFNSFSYAFDTINQAQFLSDSANESLVSSDGNFRLGFFCPGNSQFRYVGIWFNKVSIQTVVWVANRESPIKNSEGIFKVGEDGNLGIFDGNESSPLWSTNVSIPKKPSRAKLLDSGNLVLVTERGESDTGTILWQSFDYPTDTLLPGMKFGFNRKTGKTHVLTSWKSIDDPAPGEFSGKYDHRGSPQFFLCKSSVPYYRCGPWNGRRLNGLPDAITKHQMSQKVQYSNQIDLMNYTFVNDENIDVYSGFPSIVGTFTRIVLEPLGTLQRQFWHENRTWMKFWVGSQEFCDGYGRCGGNAICNLDTMVFCLCLPGFEPLHPQGWNLNCVETRKVDGCGKGVGEGFVRLEGVKWPDARNSTVYGNMTLKECERECLKSCNCTGYASSNVDESEQGCIIWYGGLKDMRQYKDEQHFYLRVDAVELAASARKNSKQFLAANSTLAFIVMPISVEVLVIAAFCYCWKRRAKSKDRKEKQSRRGSSLFDSATSLSNHEDFPYSKSGSEGGNHELTLFKLSTLMAATDNFSSANKLGRGGFGPVYKVLKDGEVIVSRGKIFALGFFSPGNSVKRYVGIWYNEISEQTVVWVANRDNPIKDTSGVLSVSSQGNLVLYKSNQTVPVWHANVSDTSADNSVVQLLDSGNLVLVRNDTGEILWQSFDRPTDTMLPHMKIGLDKRTGLNRILTSWKSWDDPGTGNSSFRMELAGFPQLFLYNCGAKWWRVGSWTGQKWSGFPGMKKGYILNYIFIDNDDEVSIAYGVIDPAMLTRIIVNDSGNEQRLTWSKQEHRWIGYFSYPKEPCDYYGHCGPNSNCNPYLWDENECTCLPGFEPKSPADWYLRDGSGGCVRKPQMPTCQRGDGFIRVSRTKVPDTSVANVNMSLGMKECKDVCLRDCSCLAYTSAHADSNEGLGCLTYHGDMVDTRTYINAGQDLFVRVDAVELALQMKNSSLAKKKIEAIVILSFIAMLLMVVVVCYSFKKKRLMENASSCRLSGFSFRFTFSQRLSYLEDSIRSENQEDGSRRNSEYLPVFDLSTIAVATNDFSSDNKLGEGGFGSVYKGVLDNGNEIAVKRLSRSSGQGIEEFKTEVALIAQLQHRNLVSILGCCIEAQEKMLIYEYLPNKSLDVSIFDETKRSLLGWNKRFEIIRGIARGILYLHQDSRLRIIHRDLKASNVLLDAAMNPKISDFGMARIFGGDQIEGNTNRVVGTYGYMAPEYAMEGLFSTKSDVYSFGVLLLEIISGRKNSAYYLEEGCGSSNLVGHIWDLWNDGRTMEIVDKSMGDSCPAPEILRCIHIGLLCVQEQAMDRPTMSTVVFMLGNDNAPPSPKHPAFIAKGVSNVEDFWTNEGVSASVNEMTITEFQAR